MWRLVLLGHVTQRWKWDSRISFNKTCEKNIPVANNNLKIYCGIPAMCPSLGKAMMVQSKRHPSVQQDIYEVVIMWKPLGGASEPTGREKEESLLKNLLQAAWHAPPNPCVEVLISGTLVGNRVTVDVIS